MALAHRLTVVGSDINNNNLDVKIYLEGFTGSAVEREGIDETFTLTAGAEDSKQLPLIYGSQATIKFKQETDFEFADLFATTNRDVYIEVYINSALFWAGFHEPEQYSEEMVSAPLAATLTGYDGLGLLKDEDFLDTDKTEYTGFWTPLEILQTILDKTGLSLPLKTAVKFRPTYYAAGLESLDKYLIDVEAYKGLKCYDVLEQLFENCRIFQRGGYWHVFSNEVWQNSNITYVFKYTAAGAADGSETLSTEFSGYTIEDIANLKLSGPLKQWTIEQNYGYIDNLVQNANFAKFDGTDFDNWTAANTTPEQRIYDTDGNKFIYIPGNEQLDPWATSNRTKYVVSDGIQIKQASDMFNIKFSFGLMGPRKSSAYMFIGAFLQADAGTDYALESYLYNTGGVREIRYRWNVNSYKLPAPVKAHVKKNGNFLFSATYEVEPDRINAYPYNEVMDHFEEVAINVEGGIPESGTLYFYLFVPHSGGTVAGACFRNIQLFITDEDSEQYPTSAKYTLINSAKNNYVPDDFKLLNADAPDIPNATTIYRGAFRLNDGNDTPTTLWTIDGTGAAYSYLELMARFAASNSRRAKQNYKIILADIIPGENMVFEDTDNTGNRFIECGIKYNFRMATVEGTYLEVLSLNLSGYSLVEEINLDNASSANSGSGGSSTQLNPTFVKDEKVSIIHPWDFNIIEQAGYLSAKYFKSVLDEVTGFSVIEPVFIPTHIEVGRLTALADHTITVTFTDAFSAVPVGIKDLKVFKLINDGGDYIIQPVLFYFTTDTPVTTTGFELEIDAAEDLTGVIVEYEFKEAINYEES